MPSYNALDLIADIYTPLLVIFSLVMIGRIVQHRQWCHFQQHIASLIIGMMISFGLMLMDNRLLIWPSLGLDYSTHSAIALVLVIFLIRAYTKKRAIWLLSFIAYALLMIYQHYHTFADIVSTAMVVALLHSISMHIYHRITEKKRINE